MSTQVTIETQHIRSDSHSHLLQSTTPTRKKGDFAVKFEGER